MAYQDDFDPDELRRRKLLESVMQPDEEDPQVQAGSYGKQTGPALSRYQELLGKMPQRGDYKPSVGRRIVGALSGIAASNPAVTTDYIQQPYQRALGDWHQALAPAQENVTLEQKAAQNDIANRRADAANISAQARQRAADATEEFRRYQEAHVPWAPRTKEEAIEFEGLKHPQQPKAWAPQNMEEYLQAHPPRDYAGEETRRVQAAKELENQRAGHEAGRQAAHDARVDARVKTPKTSTPAQQAQAENLAARELLRTNPDYAAFVSVDAKGNHVVKGQDQLPKAKFFNGVTQAQESLAREKYRQFLSDLDKKKKEVLGKQQGPVWDIQQDEEDQ